MAKRFYVEVVYASEQTQILLKLEVNQGSTVEQVISHAREQAELPALDKLGLGIWSKKVNLNAYVQEGDRIEIYRPLKCDPKQARRKRAQTARQR